MENFVKGFYRTSKAWYATAEDVNKPEVMFGLYHVQGGTLGELCIRWIPLNNQLVPQLQAFDDSWKVLSLLSNDLLPFLGELDNKNITEEQFAGLLQKLNFKDLTAYKQELKPDQYLENTDKKYMKRLR